MNPPPNLPEVFGIGQGHRKMVRQTRTQELAIRSRRRRVASVIRVGVLVLFGFAMGIYPIFGTLSPAANAAEKVPGVVLGTIPDTMAVIIGNVPELTEASLPLPTLDETSHYLATTSHYVVSADLPNCTGLPPADLSVLQNGALPDTDMCTLWDNTNKVRADAAVSLARLNHAFKLKFGRNLCIISSYRSIADQRRVKALKGHLAAAVGQSYHGWGLAVDVCPGDDRGEHKDWLDANGPTFGWTNPLWARTSSYEPWHYEYSPGTTTIGWESEGGTYDPNGVPPDSENSGPDPSVPDTTVPDPDPTPVVTPAPVVSPTPAA